MSVLFEALNKAARQNGEKASASALPFLVLSSVPDRSVFLRGALLLALAGAGLAVAWVSWPTEAPLETVAVEEPKIKSSIQLSATALEASGQEGDVQDIVEKIKDAPAAAKAKIEPRPEISVRESEVSFAEQAEEAFALFQKGNLRRAEVLYRALYSQTPQDEMLATNYGLTLAALGDEEGLLTLLEQHPDNAALHASLANLLLDNAPQEAEKQWDKAIALAPSQASYHLSLAVLCDRAGKKDKAIAHYRAALKNQKDGAELAQSPAMIGERLRYLEGR